MNDINKKKTILITIDLEDWFQVENFKDYINRSDWYKYECRYEQNIHLLLDLFDEHQVKSTFFILGWNAERSPYLIREISTRGHEIASHGYGHGLCSSLNEVSLYDDLKRSKEVLEGISGAEVKGYRAPSFSVDDRVIRLLKKIGYRYDSSFNSLGLNSRHGKLDLAGYNKQGMAYVDTDGFMELPISNIKFVGLNLPWGGGGYFRFWPSRLFNFGVKKILKNDNGYLFYMHPWEIDPEQPRVSNIRFSYRFRHYYNLDRCLYRFEKFIKIFKGNSFLTCCNLFDETVKRGKKSDKKDNYYI